MNYEYNLLNNATSDPKKQCSRIRKVSGSLQLVGNVILCIIVIILSLCLYHAQSATTFHCIESWSTYCLSPSILSSLKSRETDQNLAPVLPIVSEEPKTLKFNGTFAHPSPYKGPPNAAVDMAWDGLYNCMSSVFF